MKKRKVRAYEAGDGTSRRAVRAAVSSAPVRPAKKRAGHGAKAARGPGRPPADDSNQRESLLDAAIDCYRRDGIAATSVRSIAQAAGVTPALVNYYFGGKGPLLDAVVAERIMPAVQVLQAHLDAAGEEPQALMRAFVRGLHTAVAERPWFPSLWVREVLTENGSLRGVLLKQIAPTTAQTLAKRFASAERRGALPKGIDPRLLVVSLIGLTMFPLAAASVWRQVFAASDVDNDALMRHTLALLERGLGEHQ